MLERLIKVSDTAPEPIKAQALAFRESMRAVILAGIKGAIRSDHTTIIVNLRQAGMEDAANLVWKMGT
jgi:hypothetical protein